MPKQLNSRPLHICSIEFILSVLSDESDVYKRESFPGGSAVKTLSANAADADSIPGLERSPREGNSSTLLCSCLGNPMVRGAWPASVQAVTKSRQDLVTKQQQQ